MNCAILNTATFFEGRRPGRRLRDRCTRAHNHATNSLACNAATIVAMFAISLRSMQGKQPNTRRVHAGSRLPDGVDHNGAPK